MRVLVVDDIQETRDALLQILKELGHHTLAASSGVEAIAMVVESRPDVILLDLMMPDMDGFEVTREVRRQVSGVWIPVLVLSAFEGDAHYAHALASGAADCLLKPVNPLVLKAKLRQYQRILTLQSRLTVMAERQKSIHEHIADAVVTVTHEGQVTDMNSSGRRLFELGGAPLSPDLTLQSLTGRSLAELLERDEITVTTQMNGETVYSISSSRWSLEGDDFYTFVLHDLTEIRRVERMKDEFLAGVSHELRTPLTSILGALGLLAVGAGGELPARALELANMAKRNGDRLSQLIDDVLDLTKLEGNRIHLNARKVDLLTILTESQQANMGYAQRMGVHLAFDLQGPAAPVLVDADRFLQIMANLLSNAIKHSPAGGTVRCEVTQRPAEWQVHVIDEGPGIDPAFKSQLFEKFSQADSTDKRAVAGTGLGLYLSRLLIGRMNGKLAAENEPNKGARFTITLPKLPGDEATDWALCIAQDRQLAERLSDWISPLVHVESTPNIQGARDLIARHGAPKAVLASPQAQGLTTEFCSALSTLQPPEKIILISDAVNARFAHDQAMHWLSAASAPREQIVEMVRSIANSKDEEGGHERA